MGNFLTSSESVSFSRRTVLYGVSKWVCLIFKCGRGARAAVWWSSQGQLWCWTWRLRFSCWWVWNLTPCNVVEAYWRCIRGLQVHAWNNPLGKEGFTVQWRSEYLLRTVHAVSRLPRHRDASGTDRKSSDLQKFVISWCWNVGFPWNMVRFLDRLSNCQFLKIYR